MSTLASLRSAADAALDERLRLLTEQQAEHDRSLQPARQLDPFAEQYSLLVVTSARVDATDLARQQPGLSEETLTDAVGNHFRAFFKLLAAKLEALPSQSQPPHRVYWLYSYVSGFLRVYDTAFRAAYRRANGTY